MFHFHVHSLFDLTISARSRARVYRGPGGMSVQSCSPRASLMLLFKAANSRRIRARTLHSRTEDARMRSVRRVIAQAARRVALLKTVARAACAVGVLLGSTPSSEAQGFDLTLFVGRAFPTYD